MTIEKQFDAAMMDIYRRALSEARYRASRFHEMLMDHGGLETARTLINAPHVSDGYTELWQRGRLDLTVEALVLDHPEYHCLFTPEEVARAKARLQEYGYQPALA